MRQRIPCKQFWYHIVRQWHCSANLCMSRNELASIDYTKRNGSEIATGYKSGSSAYQSAGDSVLGDALHR